MTAELQLGVEGSKPIEDQVEFLQLENDFLASLLRRLAPGLLESSGIHDDACHALDSRVEPLLMAEKHELLVAEMAATCREIECVQAEGEVELACAQTGVADATGQQAAETARDVTALLSLLGLPLPPAAEAARALGSAVLAAVATTPAAPPAPPMTGHADAQPGAGKNATATVAPVAGAAEPTGTSARASCSAPRAAGSALPLPLPTAKQLSRAELRGTLLAQYLEDILTRHDANAGRYQIRSDILQARNAGSRG